VPKRNPKVEAWQGVVAAAAGAAGVRRTDGPVNLTLRFYFARPKGHFGTGRNAGKLKASAPALPTSQSAGDVDKLARAVLDALTGVAFDDDSQVADLTARKRYTPGPDVPEGVRITLRSAGAAGEEAG
jgi:crossover junction endodeoxyribonuclease RusA